ncbi:VTT domain-containing protein [Rhodobacter sp. NTK016B]|uniref:bifunctional DedA family/phosphatase PAP2 family protein n=1 Tax=Rhodobacter sp. NTK016B TaxID=2759676 RepID=UPI001A8F28B5|nr:bifunctional DedA family/phosphatase PAP2 family protein [Rhodobacter sp. NTK016B]MBN8292650.1 VTT domain-containing protein [Rhodobacter sp. NTK016B]
MFPTPDQILPTLASLGVLTYWVIGLASLLEGWFVTGVLVPGALVVDAGGILAQQGVVNVFHLGWFVALGSILGSELSYWTGRLARRGLRGRLEGSRAFQRAERLFERRGGLAIVLGRFLGPVSGLVPMVAALADMPHRRFLVWSVLASIPYTIFHLALGYVLGDAFTRLGPLATRVALVLAAVALVVGGLVWLARRILRFLPFVLDVLATALRAVLDMPPVKSWIARHPRLSGFVAGRFATDQFAGLPATVLAVVFGYIFAIWVRSVLDWMTAAPIVAIDTRIANLMHGLWTPGLLRIVAHITALGDTRLVVVCTAAMLAFLILRGRRGLALALTVGVAGNALSVTVLKLIFQRERPPFHYFVESTNSFPSGHAAISVAFWSTLLYVFWRLGWLRLFAVLVLAPLMAILVGGSRVFLAQHYVSDVFNGWLVGALWLVAAIVIAEWWRETRPPAVPMKSPATLIGGLLLAGAALFSAWIVVFYDKAQTMPWTGPASVVIAAPADLPGQPGFPAQTESVIGTPLEPVNLVLLAPDRQALTAALDAAGWQPAAARDLTAVLRGALTAWERIDDPTPLLTPRFWADRPNDLTYQRGEDDQRLTLRLWSSPFALQDGQAVFAALAAFPDSAGQGPDAARAAAVEALVQGGAEANGQIDAGPALRGRSATGAGWSSDGQTAVVTLP